MFDPKYFQTLLNNTLTLLSQQEKTSETNFRIQTNSLTLKYLLTFTQNKELIDHYTSQLSLLLDESEEVKESSKENILILENDLLNLAKKLKSKAKGFVGKVKDDERIVLETNLGIENQVVRTAENIKLMSLVGGLSVYTVFSFSVALFALVYFIIRFL